MILTVNVSCCRCIVISSPSGQESKSTLKNGNLSKTGNTSNKNRKRKADEKFEDEGGSNNCSLETGEQGHVGNFLQQQKKAKVSSGDSDFAEEVEPSSASEGEKARVVGLRHTAQTCTGMNLIESRTSIDNHCSKSTEPRNNSEDSGDNHSSKRTRDKERRGLSRGKKSANCEPIYGDGNVNSASCCHTGLSSSGMLSRFHRGPATTRCPVTFDRRSQPSVTAFGIRNGASNGDCKPNYQGCSVRGKGDGLVESNDNCSPPSLESRKQVFTNQ